MLEKFKTNVVNSIRSLPISVNSSFFFLPDYGHLPFLCKYSGDAGRPNSASIFVGGFVLGGIVVGTLGCIYAPQVLFEYLAICICKKNPLGVVSVFAKVIGGGVRFISRCSMYFF